jgi:superfamily II DNA/RNA helicase
MDMMAQAKELENRPHVVVATPGRIVDHLHSTSGNWDLSRVKFLVSISYMWAAFAEDTIGPGRG